MFFWVQVPLVNAKNLEDNDDVVKRGGYRYRDGEMNTKMVQNHVDTCDDVAAQVNHTPSIGNMGVRFPGGKPFIRIGHAD